MVVDEFTLAEQMLDQLEASEDIETIFRTEGKVVTVRGNQPLLLNTEQAVWMVSAGTVDLFSVLVENGIVASARSHVCRLNPGQVFFGIAPAKQERERGLVAVGSLETTVLQLPLKRLQQLAADQEFSAIGISALIDQWVAVLLRSFKIGMIPQNCQNLLPPAGEAQFNQYTAYKPHKGVTWVRHQEGTSHLMGLGHLPPIRTENCFPVDEKTWLYAHTKIVLEYIQTLDLIAHSDFWAFLQHFHRFVLESLTIIGQLEVVKEQERLKQKARDETISLNNAFFNLVAVVTPEHGEMGATTADPLLSACQVIGQQLGIHFVPHPDAQKGRNTIQDIVRASRVRMRRAVLKGQWWRHDNGPLLAYKTEGEQPVALLPISAKKYVLFDPVAKTRTPVTAKIAEALTGIAYIFYKPFPDHALTLHDILKVGFHGTRSDIVTIVMMGTLGAILGMIVPVATGIIFDTIIPGADVNQLVQIGLILVVCAAGTLVFEITKALAMLRIEGRTDCSLQSAIMDRLIALPTTFFRHYSAGDLANRSLGINMIRQILAGVTVQSVLSSIFSILYIGLLFYYDTKLAWVALAMTAVIVLVTSTLGFLYVRYERPITEMEGKITGVVFQLITGISKLRITGTEDRAFAVWTKQFSEKRKMALTSGQIQNVLKLFNAVIPVIALMVIFYFVMDSIREALLDPTKEQLSTGNFLAFLSAYVTFQTTLIGMSLSLVNSLKVIPLYNRLKPILVALPEVDAKKAHPGEITGNIEISHVNFRYKPEGPLILKDLSLEIRSGEFIAIVGGSGSGKSTLMRLLLGFETLESGTIYYDGKDLAKFDVLEIRRQIGVVLQNSQIMAGSIYDNIVGAGSVDLTQDDAWEAARMAGCEEDIRALPMGMHTVLPPGGGSLSGGQRQRIVIARAIIRKPRVLFFDEATSALDNRTQAIVSESVEQLQSTRIVIAHRLSTIINADTIYVMDQGQLVEKGTYKELMKAGGLFAELAKRQMA